MPDDALGLRPVRDEDRPAILDLLAASLGRDDDRRFEDLYAWKHETNPFGRSCSVVAVDGDRIAGFRAFMRWEYRMAQRTIHAVRAVDTATHPDYQGRGIFTRLTRHALDLVREEGVDFVFNTPNDQSRPGYLKMGWQVVGRVPITVRMLSPAAPVRMARARVPAERWSEPCSVGRPVVEVLDKPEPVLDLISSQPPSNGLHTPRTVEYLRWRYHLMDLGYRALEAEGGAAEGLAIFRVRRRGEAREIVLAELLVPGADQRRARSMSTVLSKHVRADYIIRAGRAAALPFDGFVPLPRQGPILTWRDVCDTRMPPLRDWDLSMGDIELF